MGSTPTRLRLRPRFAPTSRLPRRPIRPPATMFLLDFPANAASKMYDLARVSAHVGFLPSRSTGRGDSFVLDRGRSRTDYVSGRGRLAEASRDLGRRRWRGRLARRRPAHRDSLGLTAHTTSEIRRGVGASGFSRVRAPILCEALFARAKNGCQTPSSTPAIQPSTLPATLRKVTAEPNTMNPRLGARRSGPERRWYPGSDACDEDCGCAYRQ